MEPEPYDKLSASKQQKIKTEIDDAVTRVWKEKRLLYIRTKRGKRESAARAAEAAAVALQAEAFAREKGEWYYLDQEAKERLRKAELDRLNAAEIEAARKAAEDAARSEEERARLAREAQEEKERLELEAFFREREEAKRQKELRRQRMWDELHSETLWERCERAQAATKDNKGTWQWTVRGGF